MTTESLYRFCCDAPMCTETEIGEEISVTPDGWRRVNSTDHFGSTPAPTPRRGRPLEMYERAAGSFSLHLCPSHQSAFDAHLPRTDGHRRASGRDATLRVGCVCGNFGNIVTAGHLFVSKGPRSISERTWWCHLPEELREYGNRRDES